MTARLGGHVVTIVRPAGKDAFGDPLAGAVETDVAGCFVQPRTSSERTDMQDQVITGAVVFMAAGTDVLATDKVRFNGVVYQVDGEPRRWDDKRGNRHHLEVDLKLVEG
ncbi:hypothetical protein [Actinacidiphila oryziradicis]|jgi:hypothetical protein|uniref:phage head completion protein n=1 Tax=Actinacidiphila oryziradicis TaxID=2571141 RepID=UPI0023F01014|nr:hypothetical protein [Actinacidiphila oryziradicis]MCW2870890.1 hypothetical protein [Actinacidiphila oryziradicis]